MKLSRMLYRWPSSLIRKTPYTCNIKITQRCNLRCGFCGLWENPPHPELELVNYRYVADLLKKLGLARVVITGGEPLLRPDLPEILALFSRRGFSTTLLSNGTLLTPEKLQRLVRIGLNDLGISLDTLNPEKQAAVCGRPNVWHRAVDAIRCGVRLLRSGLVEVLVTVTGDNLDEIPELVTFITEELGAWAVVNPVNRPGLDDTILSSGEYSGMPPLDPKRVDTVYDQLQEMKIQGRKLLVTRKFLEDSRRYLKTGNYAWNCDAGERYFTIFADGKLAPCSDAAPVGSIMDFQAADFRQPAYLNDVKSVQSLCRGCIFSCWREATYLFDEPSVWMERLKAVIQLSKTGK